MLVAPYLLLAQRAKQYRFLQKNIHQVCSLNGIIFV